MLKGCCVLNIVKVSQFAIYTTYKYSMEVFLNSKFETTKIHKKRRHKNKTHVGMNVLFENINQWGMNNAIDFNLLVPDNKIKFRLLEIHNSLSIVDFSTLSLSFLYS